MGEMVLNPDHKKSSISAPTLQPREKWGNKIQFLFGCVGFSVGLGNVWRFPYLCYKMGGGAFLLPYFICVLLGAVPMFMLETWLGQYTSQGAVTCYNIVPIMKGVGYATQVVIVLHNIYYNVIMGWALYYLCSSFTSTLPWAHCNNPWNSIACSSQAKNLSVANNSLSEDIMYSPLNSTLNKSHTLALLTKTVDPVTEFWQHKVLGISSGIHDMGSIKWDLALALLGAWVIVYFGIFKGISWTSKLLYVTTTMPYVLMTVLLVRGVTLPGAGKGIEYYLLPDIEKLGKSEVWAAAATQVFFSYSMAVGVVVTLGSYNQLDHNFVRDSWLFALINSGTSILSGFVIFSVLGYMAHSHQVGIDQVAESGPGLAFIAYPKAVAHLPGAPVWSVLFFIMLIMLGMDTQFGSTEGFVTAMTDIFPQYLRRKWGREVSVGVVCAVSYLAGLPMCMNGGIYVFLLFDYYSQARIITVIAFFETIAITWVYGVKKFHSNMETMLGRRLWPGYKIWFGIITPLFNLVMSVLCLVNYSELVYNRTYRYPSWAVGVGWVMAFSSAACIPVVAIYKFACQPGTLSQRWQILSGPPEGWTPVRQDNVTDEAMVKLQTNNTTAQAIS